MFGKDRMNREMQDYLFSLDARVNRHQHHLLMVLGCYRQSARETYWPSHKTLAVTCRIGSGQGTEGDQRQVRRMVEQLELLGILDFKSGIGRGNRGSYTFLELEKSGTRSEQNRTPQSGFSNTENRTIHVENRTPQSGFTPLKPDTKQDNREPIRGIEVDLTRPFTKPDDLQTQHHLQTKSDDVAGNSIERSTVDCVLRAFEGSPATKEKSGAKDRDVALRLLKKFSLADIEYGILLGSARRISSQSTADRSGPVQSLAYFINAIDEVAHDQTFNESYSQYLRHVVSKVSKIRPKKDPQRAVAAAAAG